jgi:tetratricopeptide (TPR) repeat protein
LKTWFSIENFVSFFQLNVDCLRFSYRKSNIPDFSADIYFKLNSFPTIGGYMSVNYKLPSDLFEHFQMLHADSSYEIIRFYETHEPSIQFIDVEQQFIMLCYYSNSLFATGQFSKYLEAAERLLETSIIEDIRYVDGVDVYLHNLNQKVCAHLELQELDEAIRVAKQLLAIAPQNKNYKKLLRKALMRKRPQWVLKVFGAALWAGLLWTALEIVQLMVLEAFFPQFVHPVNLIQLFTLLTMLFCFIHGWRAHQYYVEGIVKKILKKKA